MVRVFCQKGSCNGEQRECEEVHVGDSFGPRDLIDRERAERAVEAFTSMDMAETNKNLNFNFSDFRNDSPVGSPRSSSCDSESDNGNLVIHEDSESADSMDIVMDKDEMRKARRRERNKKSAQAYRQRRRQQSGSQVKVLESLTEKNKNLHQKVKELEEEKTFIEELLKNKIKIPWHLHWAYPPTWRYHGTTAPPTTTTTGMMSPMTSNMAVSMGAPMSMSTEVTCAS